MPQRLFSTFPGSWPGLGLLLLRVAVGITALLQGGSYFFDPHHPAIYTWLAGSLGILSGFILIIGLLTPIFAAIVGISIILTAFSWIPTPAVNPLQDRLAALLAFIVSAAIMLLGPGAFSADGHRFGRREIIIPHRHDKPDHRA